jgi:hypothetical protein
MGGSFLLQDVNLDAAILRAAVRGLVARDRLAWPSPVEIMRSASMP